MTYAPRSSCDLLESTPDDPSTPHRNICLPQHTENSNYYILIITNLSIQSCDKLGQYIITLVIQA